MFVSSNKGKRTGTRMFEEAKRREQLVERKKCSDASTRQEAINAIRWYLQVVSGA